MAFKLPEKDFYTLEELSRDWNCTISDVEHLIFTQDLLRVSANPCDLHFELNISDLTPKESHEFRYQLDRAESKLIVDRASKEEVWKESIIDARFYLNLDIHNTKLKETMRGNYLLSRVSYDLGHGFIESQPSGIVKDISGGYREAFDGEESIHINEFLYAGNAETFNHKRLDFKLAYIYLESEENEMPVSLARYFGGSKTYLLPATAMVHKDAIVVIREEKDRFETKYFKESKSEKINSLKNTEAEKTLLKTIAVLKDALIDQSLNPESFNSTEVLSSQAKIIEYLEGTHKGLGKRNLENIFSKANKSIDD